MDFKIYYFKFSECVTSFQDDQVKRLYKVDAIQKVNKLGSRKLHLRKSHELWGNYWPQN